MPQQRLTDSASVVLDANGNGSVRFGPQRPGTAWSVQNVSVKCNTAVREAVAEIYRGNAGSSRISGTITGSTGDNDDGIDQNLFAGEYLTVRWTGGDVGATATATYWGTIN